MVISWISTALQGMSRPFRWWVVVAEWEQGVRVRWGRNTKLLLPGIHLRVPFLDRVFVQSVRIRTISANNQTVSTLDGKSITYSIGVRFRILNVKAMYESHADVAGTMMFDALAAAAKFIGGNNLDAITTGDVETRANQAIARSGDYAFLDGILVSVLSFCVTRSLRLISGDGWIPCGRDIDSEDNNGERK